MEFEFFSPEEKDFHGLKSLLVPYLNSQEFDSSALIDAIIAEVSVFLSISGKICKQCLLTPLANICTHTMPPCAGRET